MNELSDEVRSYYVHLRWIEPVGWCGVHRLLFHWTMHIGIDETGYADRYCFERADQAIVSMELWNGEGDPPGDWHKHPATGRRRDPKTGEVWDEHEYREDTPK